MKPKTETRYEVQWKSDSYPIWTKWVEFKPGKNPLAPTRLIKSLEKEHGLRIHFRAVKIVTTEL